MNLFEPGGKEYLKYVQQAYVSYLAGKVSLDFGKFVTPMGAEVIESKDNFNYSRGLLFALAIPYYHMGARIGYAVNDKVSLTGFLVNGWNDVIDNNSAKTVGGSISYKPNAKAGLIVNYMVGKETADLAREASVELYRMASELALTKGIVIADTKFELGFIDGELHICDEALTMDSSRFWPADQVTLGATPPSFDKQPVRDYAASLGWDKTAPAPPMPDEVIAATSARYIEAYEKITGLQFSDWPG